MCKQYFSFLTANPQRALLTVHYVSCISQSARWTKSQARVVRDDCHKTMGRLWNTIKMNTLQAYPFYCFTMVALYIVINT
jgi:hypothetical protein